MHKRRQGRVRAGGVSSVLHSDKLAPSSAVENISLGGAFLRTDRPMREGSPVVLDLVKPGLKKAIRLTGRVVSARQPEEALRKRLAPGIGVEFDPYPKEIEVRLRELLASLAPGPAVLEADAPLDLEHVVDEPSRPNAKPLPKDELRAAPSSPPKPVADETRPLAKGELRSAPSSPPKPAANEMRSFADREPKPSSAPVAVPESARLMVQVKGLLMELGDSQTRLDSLERENHALREEVKRLRAELAKR